MSTSRGDVMSLGDVTLDDATSSSSSSSVTLECSVEYTRDNERRGDVIVTSLLAPVTHNSHIASYKLTNPVSSVYMLLHCSLIIVFLIQCLALVRKEITWVSVCLSVCLYVCVCPQYRSFVIATAVVVRSSSNLEHRSHMWHWRLSSMASNTGSGKRTCT